MCNLLGCTLSLGNVALCAGHALLSLGDILLSTFEATLAAVGGVVSGTSHTGLAMGGVFAGCAQVVVDIGGLKLTQSFICMPVQVTLQCLEDTSETFCNDST